MDLETYKDLQMSNILDMMIDDLKIISEVTKKDTAKLDDDTEELLNKMLIIKQILFGDNDEDEGLDKKIKNKILEDIKKYNGLKKVEGNLVTVGYVRKMNKVVSKDNPPSPAFIKLEPKLNTEAVNSYKELTGKLPDGIIEMPIEYITYKQI